ncbi:MAG: hypothetical protein QOH66_1389, partial [Actinomycetota bacterium]|nr:hypothetical protein [Actinomycetota bacterium]
MLMDRVRTCSPAVRRVGIETSPGSELSAGRGQGRGTHVGLQPVVEGHRAPKELLHPV